MTRSIPSIFAVLRDPTVRNHPQLRTIQSASTADVWPITLRASGVDSTLEVTVNEASGDDRSGDGSRARPFQSYDRAARALGIDVEILRAASSDSERLRTFQERVIDLPPLPGPSNRHERRAAKALARRR